MGRRHCSRRFTFLAEGGVKVTWACGAQREFPDETAVDVEVLADHLPEAHHHQHHFPHHKE
jgi:hypothetical protein